MIMEEKVIQTILSESYNDFINNLASCEMLDLDYRVHREAVKEQGLFNKTVTKTKYTIWIISNKEAK